MNLCDSRKTSFEDSARRLPLFKLAELAPSAQLIIQRYKMNLTLILLFIIETGASPLQRSQRDLISWNKLSNHSSRLRLAHVKEAIENVRKSADTEMNYLEEIKAFLKRKNQAETNEDTRVIPVVRVIVDT